MSGHFNKDLFEKSYGFVKDLHSHELREMEKEAAKTKDAERKAALQRLLDKRVRARALWTNLSMP